MRSLWRRWLHTAQRIVAFVANIVLAVVYVIIIIPLGLFLLKVAPQRLSQSTSTTKNSWWIPYPKKKLDMDFAKNQ